MRTRLWFVHLLTLGLIVALTNAADAQNPVAPIPKAGKQNMTDPPGTETYMATWRAWFKQHANSDDNCIGKVEAAKIYGYSTTYDHQPLKPTAKKDDDKKDDTKKDDKKDDTKKDDKKDDTAPMSGLTQGGTSTSTKPIDKTRGDYLFISMMDKDNDEKVSQDEFEVYIHDWCRKQALHDQQTAAANAAKNRLANPNLTAAQQKQAQQEMKQAEEKLKQLASQMSSQMSALHSKVQQGSSGGNGGGTTKKPKG